MGKLGMFAMGSIALAALLAGACDASTGVIGGGTGGKGTGASGTGGSGNTGNTGTGGGATGDLPCDVVDALASCLGCHGSTPSAPIALVTYADLTAASYANAAQTVAERCVARMTDGTMPPGGGAPAADIAAIQAFIDQSYPTGGCGAGGGPPAWVDDPTGCTSGTTQPKTGVTPPPGQLEPVGSTNMNPGLRCSECHNGDVADPFSIAGTAYKTAHDTDLCNGYDGADGPAYVVVTDGNDVEHQIPISAGDAGNFYSYDYYPPPIHVKVVYNGKENPMIASPPNGDCNSCHTQDGAQSAPGRIKLPWW